MRNILVTAFLLIGVIKLPAQKGEYLPSTADLEKFFKTKTYVVLERSPLSEYNFEIKNIMPHEWEITEFDFIENEEFAEKSKNENCSFIYPSIVSFERDRTEARYIFLHLSLGGENQSLDDLRDIVSVPLGYYQADPDNYIYKLGIILRFMQKHIELIYHNPNIIKNNIFRYYNKNIKDAQDKLLYVVADELARDVSTEAKIKKVYSHRFKIVTREEIKQAIEDGNDDVIFLHKVGPENKRMQARCYKIIIGAGDADFYYFDFHKINDKKPDGFLESDFVKLNKL